MDPIFHFDNEEAEPPLEAKHVVIDASRLEVLRVRALYQHTELTKVEFRNTDKSSRRLKAIQQDAFHFCVCLHGIFQMPRTLERIGTGAFHLCSNLTYCHLPDSLQEIGEGVFESCVSLLTIRIPNSVRTIERATFRGCRQLRSIELPKTLEYIGGVAFMGCFELINICLPKSVNIRGINVFVGCRLLEPLAERASHETMDEAIIESLKDRYGELPVHHLCYYQSYDSLERNLKTLQNMITRQFYDFEEHVDALGMSPFHILALSAAPEAKLAEAIVDKIEEENFAVKRLRSRWLRILKLCWPFSSKRTMVDYNQDHVPRLLSNIYGHGPLFFACLNIAPGSTEMIKFMFRLNASSELAQFGLKRWRDEVYSLIDRELDNATTRDENTNDNDYDDRNLDYEDRLDKILVMSNHVARYLLKEKLSVLELGVWKVALEGAPNPRNRETCRTLCGADTIVTNVLPFLLESPSDDFVSILMSNFDLLRKLWYKTYL